MWFINSIDFPWVEQGMVEIVLLLFQLRLPLALSLALLVAAVVTSAEPIREKEEDSYVGKKSVTQKEGVDYLWISEPEQEGDFTKHIAPDNNRSVGS